MVVPRSEQFPAIYGSQSELPTVYAAIESRTRRAFAPRAKRLDLSIPGPKQSDVDEAEGEQ